MLAFPYWRLMSAGDFHWACFASWYHDLSACSESRYFLFSQKYFIVLAEIILIINDIPNLGNRRLSGRRQKISFYNRELTNRRGRGWRPLFVFRAILNSSLPLSVRVRPMLLLPMRVELADWFVLHNFFVCCLPYLLTLLLTILHQNPIYFFGQLPQPAKIQRNFWQRACVAQIVSFLKSPLNSSALFCLIDDNFFFIVILLFNFLSSNQRIGGNTKLFAQTPDHFQR